MQFFPDVTDTVCQHLLDKHMDVLTSVIKIKTAVFNFLQYIRKGAFNEVRFFGSDYSLFAEHSRMGN